MVLQHAQVIAENIYSKKPYVFKGGVERLFMEDSGCRLIMSCVVRRSTTWQFHTTVPSK